MANFSASDLQRGINKKNMEKTAEDEADFKKLEDKAKVLFVKQFLEGYVLSGKFMNNVYTFRIRSLGTSSGSLPLPKPKQKHRTDVRVITEKGDRFISCEFYIEDSTDESKTLETIVFHIPFDGTNFPNFQLTELKK